MGGNHQSILIDDPEHFCSKYSGLPEVGTREGLLWPGVEALLCSLYRSRLIGGAVVRRTCTKP